MKEHFLLYIDILGFSDLVINDSEKIKDLYEVVNNLNVHKHYAFHTIIFSDTILVYNKYQTEIPHNYEYNFMYLCEFVQDLIFRCNTCNLNFRAIITYGEFEHYKLEHVDCYYGKSLVHAYLKEKEINGVGLFIDKKLKKYNKFYKTTEYGFDLEFVFLFRTMFRLNEYTDSLFPLSKTHLELTDEFWLLKDEIQLLKKYFLEMNSNKNPKIRAKYLQTYQFYRQEMPLLFEQLERQGFSLSAINSEINWDEIKGYNE